MDHLSVKVFLNLHIIKIAFIYYQSQLNCFKRNPLKIKSYRIAKGSQSEDLLIFDISPINLSIHQALGKNFTQIASVKVPYLNLLFINKASKQLLFLLLFENYIQKYTVSQSNSQLVNNFQHKVSMYALQKKRDQFRKEIRRNQLDKYRDQKRKALFNQQINFQIFNKINCIFKDLEEFLAQTAFKEGAEISITMTSASFIDESITIENVLNCFHELKNIAPYKYQQVFTKYMIEKKSAERLMRIFTDLIRNEIDDSEDESDRQVQEKYNPIIRSKSLLEILKFLDILSYIVIGYDSIFLIIEGLWNILTDHLLFMEIQKFGFLHYTLSILGKLLEDSKNQTIYCYLVQKGIGTQIINLIERLKKVNVPLDIHEHLLILINNYLSCELSFQNQAQQKIGQVTINTSNVNEKETMIAYCIIFLVKQEVNLYPTLLPVISKIIQIYEFLTSSLKDEYFTLICDLISHQDRNIQIQSLNLLNDFTYHSQDCIDYLLEKGYLLDILHKRLGIENKTNDEHVNSCVEKVTYIICNCLLTQKVHLKKLALSHYIWQEVYMSLKPSSKLFPLIMTMIYFLDANGHKNFERYLIPYLQALRNFEWEHCKYKNEIKRSIENTFYNAQQHWQEHEYKNFLRILYQYGFLELIEDLCDLEIVRSIKECDME